MTACSPAPPAGAGLLVIALVTMIGVFLLAQAIPALLKDQANFLTSREWAPGGDTPRFGIVELLWTTVASSAIAMVIAVPFGVAVALFITQYAPSWLKRPAASLVDLLAAVPSIVYGLWAALTFRASSRRSRAGSRTSWAGSRCSPPPGSAAAPSSSSASSCRSWSCRSSPPCRGRSSTRRRSTHKEGALALGATRWEMIRTAVLPFGQPGVISASMLALGRALGETIAVTFLVSKLADNTPWTFSVFNGGETFASRIANNAAEFDTPAKTGAYIAAGLVLFVLTFIVNAIARVVIDRRKAFSE